jgi:tetratricopeptide (TPR) repeat protein
MWIEGKLSQWENLVATGNIFMQKSDSLPKLNDDYKWLGIANKEMKNYEEAISFFNRQQELGIKDSMEQASCYRNLIDCYNGLKQLPPAIETFEKMITYKKQKGLKISIYDYTRLEKAYTIQIEDTTIFNAIPKEEQIHYYKELISIYETQGQLSQEDIGRAYFYRLNSIINLTGVEQGKQDITDERVLKAAQELVQAVTELQSSQSEAERAVIDFYFQLYGYRTIMYHYFYSNNQEEAYKYAKIMLVEMPEAEELIGLRQKDAYTGFKSDAQQLYNILHLKFAKKRR